MPSRRTASMTMAAPLRGSQRPTWPGVWPGSARTSTRHDGPRRSVSAPPRRARARRLAAGQADVDRRVAAELALEEGDVVGRRPEAELLVPAVVAGHHRLVGLDPGAVGLAAEQADARGGGAEGRVAAAVVDVGVRDQHVVD